MLTSDLVRVRTRSGNVYPMWLGTNGGEAARAQAAELIALFLEHVGRARGELDEVLADRNAGRPDPKLEKGLVKLLVERSTFEGAAPEEAAARRRVTFLAAAEARKAGAFDRVAVLAKAGSEVGLAPDALDSALWADHPDAERLLAFEAPSPEALVEGYDLALAQAVLIRAESLVVKVEGAPPPRLRALLRTVKFHGLLTSATREGEAVTLELDGPLSLFEGTPRYGVRMAGFLPSLLVCERWSLDATVQLGRGRRKCKFHLGPEAKLKGKARDAGAWLPELVLAFEKRFAEVAPEWAIDQEVPLLNLGGEVVVPDFRFVHKKTKTEAWLEVLGYWRKGGVERRLRALKAHGAPKLVLALEQSLALDDEDVKGLEGPVVTYREIPDARKVKNILESLRAAKR